MSSVPGEVLKDILQPLSRWTLDAVQLTDKRFRQLIFGHMSDVCLRQIYHAVFQAPNEYEGGRWFIRVDNPPTREISRAHEDTARLFSEFVQALSSSCLGLLTLCRLVFTPQTAELLLQTTIHSGKLCLMEANCAELTSAQFREVLLRFSPSCLSFDACHLRQCQISDELIQAIIEKRARFFSSDSTVPLDSGRFCVTDAAIVDFCSQPDVEIRREGEGAIGELELHGGIFTKGLFQRLVEVSTKRHMLSGLSHAKLSIGQG
ncbi:hypothetical protein AAVH_17281 [Aphelenchoides avenae]|nr:hypothetical protein AAVH_17281 [Aphelenchus avenae]